MKACVLIVDDNALIRRSLRLLFEDYEMQVYEAVNGADGLQKALELNPRLVILDLSMPVMNGLETVRALRLAMPWVPLLMFTINAGPAMEIEALRAGIFAVVSKTDANSWRRLMAHARTVLELDPTDIKYAS